MFGGGICGICIISVGICCVASGSGRGDSLRRTLLRDAKISVFVCPNEWTLLRDAKIYLFLCPE